MGTTARAALAAAAALSALGVLAAPATAQAPPPPTPGPVVVVGVGGVRWSDIDPTRTPVLWRLTAEGSAAALSVRTVHPLTCRGDGWLTVGAGQRATLERDGSDGTGCRSLPEPQVGGGGAQIPGYDELRDYNLAQRYDARPGLLGDALERAGVCATAVGPGALLALADSTGHVGRYVPAGGSLSQGLVAACPLTVVDLGDFDLEPAGPTSRPNQLVLVDHQLRAVVDAVPADATLLLVGVSDADATEPHLQVALATGPGPRGASYSSAGLLTTASTRRAGLVQLTDITPTVLELLGVAAPDAAVGSTLRPGPSGAAGAAQRVRALAGLDTAAQVVRGVVPPFFLLVSAGQLALYAAAAVALRRRWAPRRRVQILRACGAAALVFATVPVATYLANLLPWWRFEHPVPLLLVAVAAGVAAVTAVSLLGRWRHRLLGPAGAIAAVTALVLGIDVLAGSRLQLSSLLGYSPLVAGRFYGFGNVAFAFFAVGALLGTASAVEGLVLRGRGRARAALAVVAVAGAVAVAVVGWPGWGADFGGVLALVPGFAVLGLGAAGARLSPARLGLVALGTVTVVTAMAVLDWLRAAEDRTHLGRFVQQVLDGSAFGVVERKAQNNWELLTSSGLTLLVPVAVVVLAFVVLRPAASHAPALQQAYAQSPTLRPALTAVLVTVVIGFAVNDSGAVIPAVALLLVVPLSVAACVRALERSQRRPPDGERYPGMTSKRPRPLMR